MHIFGEDYFLCYSFTYWLCIIMQSIYFAVQITDKMADKKDQLLIAAIDFGTTHSGYAFSFEDDYKVDPLKISTNPNWITGSSGLVSLKAPTCVLLSPRQEFMAFGFEAEDFYTELAISEEHYDYYFFKGFRVFIDEKGVSAIRFI